MNKLIIIFLTVISFSVFGNANIISGEIRSISNNNSTHIQKVQKLHLSSCNFEMTSTMSRIEIKIGERLFFAKEVSSKLLPNGECELNFISGARPLETNNP